MTAPHQNLLGISGAVAEEETDPNFNQTVLLLDGDGTNGGQNNTFLDSSTNNFSITRNGTPTQGTFNPFLGEGQYSRYSKTGSTRDSHGSGVTLGTNNFTIGMFVYPIGRSDAIGSTLNSGGNSRTTLYADTGADTFIIAHDQLLVNAGSLWTITINYTTDIALNRWQWIQVDRTGNTFRVSIDGSYVDGGGATSSGTIPAITTGTFGQRAGQDVFMGYYNNFIIINGANRGSITPPTTSLTADSNTAILLHQSNRLVNNGNTSVTLTSGGENKIVPFSPFAPTASYSESVHGGSGHFDGTGDYLSVAHSGSLQLSTNPFIIEAWIYPTECNGNESIIASGAGAAANHWLLWLASGVPQWLIYTNNSPTVLLNSGVTLPKNAWAHILVTRDSSNDQRIYINGVEKDSDNRSSPPGTTDNVTIGAQGSVNEFQGYIAGVRMDLGVSQDANFTIPSAPKTATGNDLLLSFTNASIIDQTMRHNLVTTGNAQISTSVKKFGTGSLAFDGTGDEIITATVAELASFGTGDFTVECFVQHTGNAYNETLISNRNTTPGSSTMWSLHYFTVNNEPRWHTGLDADGVSSVTTTPGTFHHIAVTRENGTHYMFIDGSHRATWTASRNYSQILHLSVGEDDHAGVLNGFLDSVRVTYGVARYPGSSAFTAPTKAFPDK